MDQKVCACVCVCVNSPCAPMLVLAAAPFDHKHWLLAVGCCWLLLVAVGCCWLLLVAAGCAFRPGPSSSSCSTLKSLQQATLRYAPRMHLLFSFFLILQWLTHTVVALAVNVDVWFLCFGCSFVSSLLCKTRRIGDLTRLPKPSLSDWQGSRAS